MNKNEFSSINGISTLGPRDVILARALCTLELAVQNQGSTGIYGEQKPNKMGASRQLQITGRLINNPSFQYMYIYSMAEQDFWRSPKIKQTDKRI